jgi:hypothetical protein
MSDDPTNNPVTTPLLSTVAIVGSLETQGLIAFAVPEPVKVVVDPTQVVKVPRTEGVG